MGSSFPAGAVFYIYSIAPTDSRLISDKVRTKFGLKWYWNPDFFRVIIRKTNVRTLIEYIIPYSLGLSSAQANHRNPRQEQRRLYAETIKEIKRGMVPVYPSRDQTAHLQRAVPEVCSSLQAKLPGTSHRMPQILRKVDCQKRWKIRTYFITNHIRAQEWYRYTPSEFSPLLRPPKPDIRTISLTNLPQRRDTWW